jgi:hypothetical protein
MRPLFHTPLKNDFIFHPFGGFFVLGAVYADNREQSQFKEQ